MAAGTSARTRWAGAVERCPATSTPGWACAQSFELLHGPSHEVLVDARCHHSGQCRPGPHPGWLTPSSMSSLFGRMITDNKDFSVEAASPVAHAISPTPWPTSSTTAPPSRPVARRPVGRSAAPARCQSGSPRARHRRACLSEDLAGVGEHRASTIRPSKTNTPLSVSAATRTPSAQRISSSEGRNAARTTATCVGWMHALAASRGHRRSAVGASRAAHAVRAELRVCQPSTGR